MTKEPTAQALRAGDQPMTPTYTAFEVHDGWTVARDGKQINPAVAFFASGHTEEARLLAVEAAERETEIAAKWASGEYR